MFGLYNDPWAYDQRTGDYYADAFGTAGDSGGIDAYIRRFGYQAAFNEVYSGILKHYIKMMTGFNVSERCFLNSTAYGSPMMISPTALFTDIQNDYFNLRRSKDRFGGTDLYTTVLPGVSDSSFDPGFEATIIAAKTTLMSQAASRLSVASEAVSNLEMQSLTTMMYKTLPMSADKYRNQGLLPKKFDRIFCIAIDPEKDFTPYDASESDTTMDRWQYEFTLEDTGYESIDGLLYSFVVDVGLAPMDSDVSVTRANASGEDIIE